MSCGSAGRHCHVRANVSVLPVQSSFSSMRGLRSHPDSRYQFALFADHTYDQRRTSNGNRSALSDETRGKIMHPVCASVSRAVARALNRPALPLTAAAIALALPTIAAAADELQEVVVTAQFRKENLQDTPI